MVEKDKKKVQTRVVKSPVAADKKKAVASLKTKENDKVAKLDFKKVKEYNGPFKHRVTGKEFNSFVIETQNAIIRMKQDMLSFTSRVDDIGVDLDSVDKRHNKVSEATVQALQQAVDEMQKRDLLHTKSIRVYQIITALAVLTTIASFIIFLVK